MKYGIVIYPPREVQDRANALRKRYDSHYSLIPPHITLVDAFEWENISDLTERIEKVAQTIPPFTLKLNKVGTFLPLSPVVYFGFEKNDTIYNLHEKLIHHVLDHEQIFKFTPHLTIAQDLSEQELYDILGRLKMKEYNMEVPVDRIHLCYQLENESWTVYQTFLLKENK
ncbi:2'-5' RNA ligase family protein [Tepidibacillus fermentans]|uniref:Putative phosphoesterase EDD72_101189 n=1 Tax=Tepidibacillus fermentans TaxID=1281767 RepID=A0A4R3KLQ0_9BACI|nr:2'-5' RNA ligase family protein [Tepidibacillus fermentans]TCS84520.1 2'-5' RNA ligase [Tepidibacillus fermentans]